MKSLKKGIEWVPKWADKIDNLNNDWWKRRKKGLESIKLKGTEWDWEQ